MSPTQRPCSDYLLPLARPITENSRPSYSITDTGTTTLAGEDADNYELTTVNQETLEER